MDISTSNSAFWGRLASFGALMFAGLAIVFAALSPFALFYADAGLALVEQHFAEPKSVFPATSVALFLLLLAALCLMAALYLAALRQVVSSRADERSRSQTRAGSWWAMAWLYLAMWIAIYPLQSLALEVETAFKGPTSEVAMAYPFLVFLALTSAFVLAGSKNPTTEEFVS